MKKFEIPVRCGRHNIDVSLRGIHGKHNVDIAMHDRRNIDIIMRDKHNADVLVRKIPIVNLGFILRDLPVDLPSIPDTGYVEFNIADTGRLALSTSDVKLIINRLRMLYETDHLLLSDLDAYDIVHIDFIIDDK